jgi:hypothetical protein
MIESLERSVCPLLFGCAHALFIDSLGLQTIVLGILEAGYLAVKVFALRSTTPRYKFKVCMLLVSSLLRMGFSLSFYLYENTRYPELINDVHYDMAWSYIICWLAEFSHDIIVFLLEVVEAVKGAICGKKHKKKNK